MTNGHPYSRWVWLCVSKERGLFIDCMLLFIFTLLPCRLYFSFYLTLHLTSKPYFFTKHHQHKCYPKYNKLICDMAVVVVMTLFRRWWSKFQVLSFGENQTSQAQNHSLFRILLFNTNKKSLSFIVEIGGLGN